MKVTDPILAFALSAALALPAFAQTPAAPAAEAATEVTTSDAEVAQTGISMGEEVKTDTPAEAAQESANYIKEEHGDWKITCVRTDLGADPCQMYQLMKDDQGNSVAEINLFNLPKGAKAVAAASIVTPLETLLTQQVTLQVDSAQPKRYPFTLCAPMGCIAQVGFTQGELDAFKRGNKAAFTIVPAMLPDEKVAITMSLKGFTAAYDAVSKLNTAADAAAAEAAKAAVAKPE